MAFLIGLPQEALRPTKACSATNYLPGLLGLGTAAVDLPALKANAHWRQGGGDCGWIAAAEVWRG